MTHNHITALAIVAALAAVVVEKCAPRVGVKVEEAGSVSSMEHVDVPEVKPVCAVGDAVMPDTATRYPAGLVIELHGAGPAPVAIRCEDDALYIARAPADEPPPSAPGASP